MLKRAEILAVLLIVLGLPAAAKAKVVRAELKNGLKVVIIPDPLAPVVSIYDNYKVGANETPAGFPGTAHAQEHMMFRGCAGVTADQSAAVFAQLGGVNNADTEQNITQYFETVPSQDLEIALHMDAACMKQAADSPAEWNKERGAIEQEVASDLSNPSYKLFTRINHDMFAGTPYEHDALGTVPSFEATTAGVLQHFYTSWYAPNNAILVIAGDVNPDNALKEIKALYGPIAAHELPSHPAVNLPEVKPENFTLPSDYPYTLTTLAFRLPGSDSKDYAATHILADVLASQRADIYGLVPQGKALDAGFQMVESYRKASVALAFAALPAGADVKPMLTTLRNILANYVSKGVPKELIEAAKRSEIASAEFERNSIPGLASLWSDALASEGRTSPQQDVDAIRKVSVKDVDRVAREYLTANAIAGSLVPEPSGQAAAMKGFGGKEKSAPAPTKPVPLPSWAQSLRSASVPKWDINPADMTLPNGIRLIVKTDRTTPTVTLSGEIRQQPNMEVAAGREGVSGILESLFPYGTTRLNRLEFEKALDDIAASESAGAAFSLQVLNKYFDRGVQLLAANELQPGLPESAFKVVQKQLAQSVSGLMKTPGWHAERATLHGLLPKDDPALRHATPQTVNTVTLADVRSYYEQAYRPDLTTIVVIGDITPQEARSTIEKYFGAWKASGPKPAVDLPPVPPNRASASDVPDPTSVQDTVTLSEELPMNRFNPDYYALQLGNHVLGGGFYATRLYRDLRETTGYVYYVGNELASGRTRTNFSVSYGCDPKNVSRAREIVDRDLKEMQTSDATPSDLEQAKTLLLRQIPLAEASETSVAAGLLGRAVFGLPLDEPIRAAQKYARLTPDQVRLAFAKWIRPDDLVEVVQGPQPH